MIIVDIERKGRGKYSGDRGREVGLGVVRVAGGFFKG